MKKISIILVTVFSGFLFACGGSTKAPESTTPVEESVETVEAPVVEAQDTMNVSQALTEYEKTVEALIPALLNMQKGDTKAIKEYQKLSADVAKLVPILDKKTSEMNEKELKKYKEIADRLYRSTNPNAPAPEKKK